MALPPGRERPGFRATQRMSAPAEPKRVRGVAVQVAAHVAAAAVGFAGVWYGVAPAIDARTRGPERVAVNCDHTAAANGARDGCIYIYIEGDR